jgi:Tol biopolymer transport system component
LRIGFSNHRLKTYIMLLCAVGVALFCLGVPSFAEDATAAGSTETATVAHGLALGDTVPDFALADKDGTRYLGKDYVSKGKLLFFYIIKLGESNVSRELGHVDDLADDYPDEMNAFVVLLNADKNKITKLASERKYAFPMLMGQKKFLDDFRLGEEDLPAWVLAGRDGKVLATGGKELPTTADVESLSGLPPQPRIPGLRLPGERVSYFFARNLAGMEESILPLIGDGSPLLLYFTAEKVPNELNDIKAFWELQTGLTGVQMRLIIIEPSDDHRKEIAAQKEWKNKGILFGDKTVADLYDTWGRMPMWVLADGSGNVLAVRPTSGVPETEEVLALLSGPKFPGDPTGFSIDEERVVLDKLLSNYAVAPSFSADGKRVAWSSHDRFTLTDQLYCMRLVKEEPAEKEKTKTKSAGSKETSSKYGLDDYYASKYKDKLENNNDNALFDIGTKESEDKDKTEVTNETGETKPYTGLDLNFRGTIRRLSYSNRDNIAPAWSPTGTELAFHSDRSKFEEIWTMNPVSGGLFEQVTYFRSRAEFPSYTSDGDGMVIGADKLGSMDIWVLGPSGRTPYPLVVADGDQNDPAVSPDGKYVVFTWQTDTGSDIWKVRLDGKELVNITENDYPNYMADWSPDCKFVVFVSERSGRPELWICRADGSGAAQLTNEPGDKFFPSWNYDGVHLIYSRREADKTFSLILLKLNGWDVSTQVVDRVAAARTAQASQKKKSKKEEAKEKRYNPAEGTAPTGTYMGK